MTEERWKSLLQSTNGAGHKRSYAHTTHARNFAGLAANIELC